jgi:hypothetical protein
MPILKVDDDDVRDGGVLQRFEDLAAAAGLQRHSLLLCRVAGDDWGGVGRRRRRQRDLHCPDLNGAAAGGEAFEHDQQQGEHAQHGNAEKNPSRWGVVEVQRLAAHPPRCEQKH